MQSDHPRQKGFYIRKLGLRDHEPKAKGIRKPARECARQARERKKAYITNLEVDLADAKKKLHIATQEIMQLKQLLSHKEVEDKQYQSGNEGFEGLMVEFQKLYENLQRGNTGEISRSLSFLRDKFGISGRERFKNIDALLDRMVSILMPMHYRLLMDNATKSTRWHMQISNFTSCWARGKLKGAW